MGAIQQKATSFSDRWKSVADNTISADQYWKEFFDVFGIDIDTLKKGSAQAQYKGRSFIAYHMEYEAKKKSWDFDIALEDMFQYVNAMVGENKPKYIILTDTRNIYLFEMTDFGSVGDIITLSEFADNVRLFYFLTKRPMTAYTTFEELAMLQRELLKNQPPVTLEEAREQAKRIKEWSKSANKKKK